MDDLIIFHPKKKYCIQYTLVWFAALPLLLFFAILILIQDYGQLRKIVFLTIIATPLFVGILLTWRSPRKVKLSISIDNIQGSIGNQSFQIPFSEILHIANLNYYLRIDARNAQLFLPNSYFDLEQIQVELKKRLHPNVFVDEGWVNLPAYQPIKKQQDSLLAEISDKLPLQIKQELPVVVKTLLMIFIALSLVAAFLSWRQLGFGSLWFLLFAFLCGISFIHKGVLKIDNHQITYETRFRKYRILWDDVVRVEHDDALSLAFHGQNQCLRTSTNSDFIWGKAQKDEFFFYLDHIIKQKNIQRRQTQWASFRFNKNTRVPK